MDLKLSWDDKRSARTVLQSARETLPGRWCRGADARTSTGNETTPGDTHATQFCVVGTIRRCARETNANVLPALYLLHAAVCSRYPWMLGIPANDAEAKANALREWNDGTAEDLHEVLRLFDHALVLLG
jgi:hypothetical protein